MGRRVIERGIRKLQPRKAGASKTPLSLAVYAKTLEYLKLIDQGKNFKEIADIFDIDPNNIKKPIHQVECYKTNQLPAGIPPIILYDLTPQNRPYVNQYGYNFIEEYGPDIEKDQATLQRLMAKLRGSTIA